MRLEFDYFFSNHSWIKSQIDRSNNLGKRKESQTVIYFYTTTILFIHWNEGIQHHDTECLHLVEVKTLSCNHTQFSTTKMERKGDTNKKITKQEDNHNKSHTLN